MSQRKGMTTHELLEKGQAKANSCHCMPWQSLIGPMPPFALILRREVHTSGRWMSSAKDARPEERLSRLARSVIAMFVSSSQPNTSLGQETGFWAQRSNPPLEALGSRLRRCKTRRSPIPTRSRVHFPHLSQARCQRLYIRLLSQFA